MNTIKKFILLSSLGLRQVDFDGTTTYSTIRAVAGQGGLDDNAITVFPNPVEEVIKIRFEEIPQGVEGATVQIISVHGQLLHEFTTAIQSYQVLEIDFVKDLPAAMYTLSIELNTGERLLKKFVKKHQ